MKKEECVTEKCKNKSSKKRKFAIGAIIASAAALVGIGAVIKNKKSKKDKQA